VSTPKVPPEIARKIAAMKAAPQAAPGKPVGPAAAPRPAPAQAPKKSMSLLAKAAIAGWVVGAAAGGAAYFIYTSAEGDKQAALAEQAAGYDAQIAQLKADSAAVLKRIQDDATAASEIMKAELDFAKMPELPLETEFRANQVLYVENKLGDTFTCKVRLFRPIGGVTKEVDFSLKARTFQDLAAIGDWLFAKGDKVEFVKPGFKPRSLVAQ
jgi:hypothetical protein